MAVALLLLATSQLVDLLLVHLLLAALIFNTITKAKATHLHLLESLCQPAEEGVTISTRSGGSTRTGSIITIGVRR